MQTVNAFTWNPAISDFIMFILLVYTPGYTRKQQPVTDHFAITHAVMAVVDTETSQYTTTAFVVNTEPLK